MTDFILNGNVKSEDIKKLGNNDSSTLLIKSGRFRTHTISLTPNDDNSKKRAKKSKKIKFI